MTDKRTFTEAEQADFQRRFVAGETSSEEFREMVTADPGFYGRMIGGIAFEVNDLLGQLEGMDPAALSDEAALALKEVQADLSHHHDSNVNTAFEALSLLPETAPHIGKLIDADEALSDAIGRVVDGHRLAAG